MPVRVDLHCICFQRFLVLEAAFAGLFILQGLRDLLGWEFAHVEL